MKKAVRKWAYALLGTLFLMTCWGCNSPHASVSQDFQGGCWNMSDTLDLSFENADTNQVYKLWFPLTLTGTYTYNNIYLRAILIPPTGAPSILPARFALSAEDGTWLTEADGDEAPFDLLLSGAIRFNQKGTYQVRLLHYMRDSVLCGVKSAGITIDRAEPSQEGA